MNILLVIVFLVILFLAFTLINQLSKPSDINKLLSYFLFKKKRKNLNSNNQSLYSKEKSDNTYSTSPKDEVLKEKFELIVEDLNDETESTSEPMNVEFIPNGEKVHYQHYYLVKEIVQNKLTHSIISVKEYVFASPNLHKSKEEARLFYDNKITIHPKNDEYAKFLYELFLVNNVFFDAKETISGTSNSSNNIKSYLLIDSEGKIHQDGRNFEYFVLSTAAKKMNEANEVFQSSVKTKNSFLDGNYKD